MLLDFKKLKTIFNKELNRKLITSNKNVVRIKSKNPKVIEHFEDKRNFADIVLKQINKDRFYDFIFENKKDLIILDIGGNIGLFSLYVQDVAKVVYPIEPTPTHFEILKELTKDYQNIKPLNVAVHDKNEKVNFYINYLNSTMNGTANNYGIKIEVEGKTLATIIKDLNLDHVDFVKCDIEGSEMIALNNQTIGEVKDIIDSWFIEVHQTEPILTMAGSTEKNRSYLTKIFEKNGYQVDNLRHDAMYVYKKENNKKRINSMTLEEKIENIKNRRVKAQQLRTEKDKQRGKDLLGGKCVSCGSIENLHFDHIDPKTKSFSLSMYWGRRSFQNVLLPEILKCQLLCHSCHIKKTHFERIGSSNPLSKLTEEQAREIHSSNEPIKVLAEKYGISRTAIGDIKRGTSWTYLFQEINET